MKNKKTATIIICTVIALSLTLLCVLPAIAKTENIIYSAFGDSIAAGYRLTTYTGDGSTPIEGYVAQFAAEIGAATLNDKAVTGSDTSDMLNSLDNDASYCQAMSDADVITLSMGSNDILGPGQAMIMEALGITNYDPVQLSALLASENLLTLIRQISDYVKLPAQAARFESAVAQYKTNWVSIIDKIRELNPDATLIVNNYYNPYQPLSMYAFLGVDLSNTVQIYLDDMNAFITNHEYNNTKYSIADVTAVGNGLTNVSIENKELDPHPNAEGHAHIYGQVKAVYLGDSDTTTTEEPVVTTTEEPVVTTTEEPVVTTTEEPVVTTTEEPVVTTTEEPVVTTTEEPVVTTTEEPVVTTTEEPVVTTTEEPVVTTTEEPVVTTTEEPVVTTTEEPGVNETTTAEPVNTTTSDTDDDKDFAYTIGCSGLGSLTVLLLLITAGFGTAIFVIIKKK